MRSNPQSVERTKKNLMEAFWELYCKNSIRKISVQKIVDRAGYNRSTFYRYFTDVYDILDQFERKLLPDFSKHQKLMASLTFRKPLEHLTEVYSRYKKYYLVLLGENGDPAFHKKMKDAYKELTRPFFQLLCENDFQLEMALEFCISGFVNLLTFCFAKNERLDIEKIMSEVWPPVNNVMQKILYRNSQIK